VERPWELHPSKKNKPKNKQPETLEVTQLKKIKIDQNTKETLLTFFSTKKIYVVKKCFYRRVSV